MIRAITKWYTYKSALVIDLLFEVMYCNIYKIENMYVIVFCIISHCINIM